VGSVPGLFTPFTPAHRGGGSGPPLLLLHGFMDTWRGWELVLPALERRHDVLAVTLPGHAGGPPLDGAGTIAGVLDRLERVMEAAGWTAAHLAGNSLGGHLALRLAERGRAESVVAFAPAGGWPAGDAFAQRLLTEQAAMYAQARAVAPRAPALLATAEGRRRATERITVNHEHLPAELLAHQVLGLAACDVEPLVANARRERWELDAARIACPVRIVWGTEDRLLPWPAAAARYRTEWLPHADWVVLDGVGHAPQLDVPLETAELILGHTAR
jgi:pimeloyl-ACP methyl ester carboxylesterase